MTKETLSDKFWKIFNENSEDQSAEAIYRRESLMRYRIKVKESTKKLKEEILFWTIGNEYKKIIQNKIKEIFGEENQNENNKHKTT